MRENILSSQSPYTSVVHILHPTLTEACWLEPPTTENNILIMMKDEINEHQRGAELSAALELTLSWLEKSAVTPMYT